MIDIKFRAWHFENKEFCYAQMINIGSLVFTPKSPDPKMFGLTEFPTYSDPEQYTGLKDKNGTEIYEGDIVNFIRDVAVVEYQNTEFLAMVTHKDAHWCNILDENCIVIGNIHESPELLK